MPFVYMESQPSKFRLLISGFSKSGKTSSFITFLYGTREYFLENGEVNPEALEFYESNPYKSMTILNCPGEFGSRTLFNYRNIPNMECIYYEAEESEDVNSVEWSEYALAQFDKIFTQVVKDRPNILVLDGIHSLWSHIMNRTTGGEYLQGLDLNINPKTGNVDPYRSARFHNQSHNAFGQYIAGLYNGPIPFIICTTWEEWEQGQVESSRPGGIESKRYLWPSIPGKMAKEIVGKFDARISARLHDICSEPNCLERKSRTQHHVWQILPDSNVVGLGINGLNIKKLPKSIREVPFIHQNYANLKELIEAFS